MQNNDEPIRIRGHHLNMLASLAGRDSWKHTIKTLTEGYGLRFLYKAYIKLQNLKKNPEQEVMLVEGLDDICEECPKKRASCEITSNGGEIHGLMRVDVNPPQFIERITESGSYMKVEKDYRCITDNGFKLNQTYTAKEILGKLK